MVSNYKLFVEIGRAARIKNNVHKGEVVVIVDILDAHRYMVEGPNVTRTMITSRNIELLNIVLNVPRGCSSEELRKAFTEQKLVEKYQQTGLYKRDQKAFKRANLTDFERFIVKTLKKQKKQLILKEYLPMKAEVDKTKKEQESKVNAENKKKALAKKRAIKKSFKFLGKKIAKRVKAQKAYEARQAANS
jgi:large subunit ribosomal protein L14e